MQEAWYKKLKALCNGNIQVLWLCKMPDYLRKIVKVKGIVPQHIYTEKGFDYRTGVPNYTRILAFFDYITLCPGFQGRKAGCFAQDSNIKQCEPNQFQSKNWWSWWCTLGRWDEKNPEQTDDNGWTALMHACDSSFFHARRRGLEAVLG